MSETKLTIRTENAADRSVIATLLAKTYLAEGVKAIEIAGEVRRQEGRNEALSLVGEAGGTVMACSMFAPSVYRHVGGKSRCACVAWHGYAKRAQYTGVY